jgi:hypothetical protein
MNKKSAMVIASGLVLALLAGVAAVSLTLSGGSVGAASAVTHQVKPIVRTEKRTVTIHKKAKATAGSQTIVRVPSSQSAIMSAGSFEDDRFEAESAGFERDDLGGGGDD